MNISEFFQKIIGFKFDFPDLQALDKLAGKSVGDVKFYANAEDCVANIQPWMPIYFFPIGHEFGLEVGIHLRPSDINSGRLAIIRALTETDMIEVALSLPHYIFLCLANDEGHGYEDGKTVSSFETSVTIANEVFGQDFYQPGSYGYFIPDEIQRISSNYFGKSPYFYHKTALFEDNLPNKLKILQAGIASEAGCMVLYTDLVEVYYELGNYEQAARMFVNSMKCLHHTAYSTDIEQYYEIGRTLIQSVPEAFPAEIVHYLNITDDREHMLFAMQPYKEGNVAETAKRLCDLCHLFGDYNTIINEFQEMYSQLGYKWALALCSLRISELTDTSNSKE